MSLINSGQDVFYAITKRQTMASEKRKSLLYTFTFFSQTVNMQTEIMYAFELDSNEASFHYAHFPFNTTLSLTIRNIEYS